MWYFLAVVVALGITATKWRKFYDDKKEAVDVLAGVRILGVNLLIFGSIATVLSAVVVISAGHRGVVFDSVKGVRPVALNEGLNFVTPFIQTCYEMDVRTQKAEFESSAASKDLQEVSTKMTVNFSPVPAAIPQLFQTVGMDYVEKIVHPAVQEALKAATAKFTAEELITKRELVKQNFHDHLTAVLSRANVTLTETYITDFQFSKPFAAAIEAKQVAAQEVMTAQNKLLQVKVEAEQKIAQYRAEAEGLRLKQAAITPLMVRMEAIRQWNGVLPQVMMGGGGGSSGGGGIPFLDISHLPTWESKPRAKNAAEMAQPNQPATQAKAPAEDKKEDDDN